MVPVVTLDLYAYGRAQRQRTGLSAAADESDQVYTCGGCGSSGRTKDPGLLRVVGWRLREVPGAVARKPLCPRCARRFIASLV